MILALTREYKVGERDWGSKANEHGASYNFPFVVVRPSTAEEYTRQELEKLGPDVEYFKLGKNLFFYEVSTD